MTTCAVYLRISKDKGLGTDDEGLAVDRQRKDIHKLLKSKGWNVGTEYLDNDVSASGKVKRPAYERMLADFEAGSIDAIAAWDLDRLWRVPMEFEHLLNLSEKQGLKLATVGGDADLATDSGQLFARIKVAVAQSELTRRSARQKAKFAQDREAGKDHWRKRRPFGLTLEGKLVPEEAEALKDIAEIILSDGTITAGVSLLKERGLKTTFGQEWQRQPLRRTLLNPRIAGFLEHEGEIVKAQWEAVLERDTWEAVVAKLNTKNRPKPKTTKHEYMLSGLLTCGECGDKCYGRQTKRKRKSGVTKIGYIYRCNNLCTSKELKKTDDLVILRTLEAVLTTDHQEIQQDKGTLQSLREARAHELKRWADWLEQAAEQDLRPSEIKPHRAKHESKLRDIENQIAQLEKVTLVRLPTLDEALESTADDQGEIVRVFNWDALSLEKRRHLVSLMWDSVTLKRTGRGARWSDDNIVFVERKAV
ncbi:recombinase family protein [Paenarthrobacter nicotinovorans]|uniref:recombinase family protein n=1 Tax=Paenarthrobacter nicotinovorans TaxID=29320 RepID=UPI0009EE4C72|nr:recombinase family protein [Paenarthrobacter nicotinovorans]